MTGRHSFLKHMLTDQRGGIAIVFGVASSVLFALGALVIDGGQLYVTKTRLQGTADAAALAGTQDLPNEGMATAAALQYARKNMPTSEHGPVLTANDITFGVWDEHDKTFTAGAVPADAVQVTVRRSSANNNAVDTHFAHLIGFGEVDVDASSIATTGNPSVCVLALEPHAQKGIHLGNGEIDAESCVVQVLSDHATAAVTGNPNGGITAENVCVAGGYDTQPSYSPSPDAGCPPLTDPLAWLQPPSYGGCDHNWFSVGSGDSTVDPGVYCGGISIMSNGTVTFNPGLYVMKDGSFDVGGGARLVGQGVTFYFIGSNAKIDLSGGGEMTFSAPLTGDLAGILFFGDRSLSPPIRHSVKGGGEVHYEGTVYFPTTDVLFAGNGTGASSSPYSFFIARQFAFTGNGNIDINADYEASAVPIPPRVGPQRSGLVR